jgi:hypothetical protein
MALGAIGKTCIVFPASFYMEGCRELGLPEDRMESVFPSTGYFGIFHILREFIPKVSLCDSLGVSRMFDP